MLTYLWICLLQTHPRRVINVHQAIFLQVEALRVLLVQLVQNPALIGASATRVQPEQPLSVV